MDAATVRRRAAEVRSKILHDYSRFTVLTIDTFFQRILRAFIKELGIDLNYNVEIETASVLTKSADTLIEQITTDRDLQRWLTDFVQERIDEGKKWDIRDGILTLGGELFKEKNKDALSAARPREELARIVGEATAHAAATKKQMQDAAAGPYGSWPMRRRADGLHGQEPQFRPLFLTVAARAETLHRHGRQNEPDDRGWAPKGSPARRSPPGCNPCCAKCAICTTPTSALEHLRPAARELPQLRAAVGPLRQVQQLCDEQNMMLLRRPNTSSRNSSATTTRRSSTRRSATASNTS
ncbi:MAG: hypothetical protein ACLRMJ_06620 [Alistipes finegoldii]